MTNQAGFATLIALLMLGMLTLIGLAALSTSDDEVVIAGNELQEMRAFYAAEAGLERITALMQQEYDSTGAPPVTMPSGSDSLNLCSITYVASDDGAAEQKILTSGSLSGLHALVKSFTISSEAVSEVDQCAVQVSQSFETALVPIFQFAVFYENDLWATPANDMTIGGRVHVNGNMYLQANTDMYFNGRVTASGGIHHGFPGGMYSGSYGDVWFKDNSGAYQSMYQGGDWLDCDDPDWYVDASSRWGGQVRDEAFGEESLNLPLTNGSHDAHKIIERAAGNPDSYENKADLRIIDGVPYANVSGSWTDVSAWLPAGTITNTSFYDDREDEWVNSTDIDMGLLAGSAYFPSNGVVYSSDQRSGYNGTRLKNGSDIGSPLSVFCENPVYVQGDYNTVDKQPAAICADAVTYLSNSWNDTYSNYSYGYRNATATTVNASMITGDLDTDVQTYSGGLANLPRFLENWAGRDFTLRGSMVALWRTRQASGYWHYGDSYAYYSAPTRNYVFDTDLNDPNKLPPATPAVRVFNRTGWQQSHISFVASE